MMTKVMLLALGGALGALARAGVTVLAQRAFGARFPWGTLAVNLLGCLLFGLVWAMTEGRERHVAEVRIFVLTGFMGAFTTFSTFAFDSVQLAQASKTGMMLGNVALHNLLGLACLLVGLLIGRSL